MGDILGRIALSRTPINVGIRSKESQVATCFVKLITPTTTSENKVGVAIIIQISRRYTVGVHSRERGPIFGRISFFCSPIDEGREFSFCAIKPIGNNDIRDPIFIKVCDRSPGSPVAKERRPLL